MFLFLQVYKRGLISFGESVVDPSMVQINDSDLLLLFPFRWNTEAVASNYTTVRAVVHNCTDGFCLTAQMRVAWLYLYFGTNFEFKGFFVPRYLVMIEWRNLTFPCCPDQVESISLIHTSTLYSRKNVRCQFSKHLHIHAPLFLRLLTFKLF